MSVNRTGTSRQRLLRPGRGPVDPHDPVTRLSEPAGDLDRQLPLAAEGADHRDGLGAAHRARCARIRPPTAALGVQSADGGKEIHPRGAISSPVIR
jgi:hypothetical protein